MSWKYGVGTDKVKVKVYINYVIYRILVITKVSFYKIR